MTRSEIIQKFHVTMVGQGAPTMVLAHGFGSDQTAWRHQVAVLAARHQLVLFDHLGCGKADVRTYHPRRYRTLEPYVEDVLQIYDALELRDTVYVGHSAGAMIGMLASLARPAAFTKLIVIGASPRYLNDGDYIGGFTHEDLNRIYAVMADDYLGWANGFAPLVVATPERPDLGQEFARTLGAMRPDIAQSVARVIFEADIRARLPELQHPVLVVQTQSDLFVPSQVADYLAAHIPQSRLVRLDAQGHVPHLSAPGAVTAAMRGFLEL